MPIYEFECNSCGARYDVSAKMDEIPPHVECDKCDSLAWRLIVSSPIVFRGEGWAKKDRTKKVES